jgi:hypothetical protein
MRSIACWFARRSRLARGLALGVFGVALVVPLVAALSVADGLHVSPPAIVASGLGVGAIMVGSQLLGFARYGGRSAYLELVAAISSGEVPAEIDAMVWHDRLEHRLSRAGRTLIFTPVWMALISFLIVPRMVRSGSINYLLLAYLVVFAVTAVISCVRNARTIPKIMALQARVLGPRPAPEPSTVDA